MNEVSPKQTAEDISVARANVAREAITAYSQDTAPRIVVDRWDQQELIAAAGRLADQASTWNQAKGHLVAIIGNLSGIEFDQPTSEHIEELVKLTRNNSQES